MRAIARPLIKFGIFAAVMTLLTAMLFAVFGQYRPGDTNTYSAVFSDVSRLKAGDTVRIAGVVAGTVTNVELRDSETILVRFNADRSVVLTTGTRALVRYLNLVGDRYLELTEGAGATAILPAGSEIPLQQTAPALDLDLLLGGLKPVIRGLNPQDVNALSASLIEIVQGQGTNLESLFSQVSSFTNNLADRSTVIQQLIDNLRGLLKTLSDDRDDFSSVIDRLERLVGELSAERDPIADAITSLESGTASFTDLLASARPPLARTVEQLNRLAPALDDKKDRLETMFNRLPDDYRKLARIGSYGSFINYYACALTVRATDLQGRTVVFPVFRQEGGRCSEP
jgi:phospholipid/cholesterol/gamma-HCH transport system substrate-binding protein